MESLILPFICCCLIITAQADKSINPTYPAVSSSSSSSSSAANSIIPNGNSDFGINNNKVDVVTATDKVAEKSDVYVPPQQQQQQQQQQQPQQPPTQGYYYYYYPVSSNNNNNNNQHQHQHQPHHHQQTYSSGGHPQGGYGHPQAHHGGYSGGGVSNKQNDGPLGALGIPLLVLLALFVALLVFGVLSTNDNLDFGRSFKNAANAFGDLDLGIDVVDAIEMARNVLDAVNKGETIYK